MQKADWNQYLELNNVWTRRLLGLEEFSRLRNLDQIEREYNQDKYGSLNQTQLSTVEEYIQLQYESLGLNSSKEICMAISEELFKVEFGFARFLFRAKILEIITKYQPKRICELGCGYGMNFPLLQAIASEVYGGEFSENAVKIANRLNLDIRLFNYYNPDDYGFIRDKSLIFTSHSIEQLPSAQCFIDNLAQIKEKVDVVVHFEPTFLKDRTSFVGLLRNRYAEMNDYNQDLVDLLQQRDDIERLEFYPDYVGLNPLNPTCILVWKFR